MEDNDRKFRFFCQIGNPNFTFKKGENGFGRN